MKYTQENRSVSIFDALLYLSNSGLSIYTWYLGTGEIAKDDDADIEYVRKNTMNAILVKMESMYDIFSDDVDLKFKKIEVTIIAIMTLIFSLSILLYLVILVVEIKYS